MNQQRKLPLPESTLPLGLLIKYLPSIMQLLRYLRKVATNIGKADRV